MERNCYVYTKRENVRAVIHFSDIPGWSITTMEDREMFYPFVNIKDVIATFDRPIYEAWLRYKNGDLLVEKVETSIEMNGLKVSEPDEDEIEWDDTIVPLEEIMHWVMTTDNLNPFYRVIAPVIQGQYSKIELKEMGGADAEAKYEKWRQWSIKNGNTYPTLDEMQA